MRRRRPFVTLKIAMSLDGRIAAAPRRAHAAHLAPRRTVTRSGLRAEVDAIGVGSETVLVDDPLLTARDVFRERPLTRVVFDCAAAHAAGRAPVHDARRRAGHRRDDRARPCDAQSGSRRGAARARARRSRRRARTTCRARWRALLGRRRHVAAARRRRGAARRGVATRASSIACAATSRRTRSAPAASRGRCPPISAGRSAPRPSACRSAPDVLLEADVHRVD